MTETARHACRECTRTDLSLTANGRIRSHAENGKRPGPDNPNCPGGSDLPRDTSPCTHPNVDGIGQCKDCSTDLRPTLDEVDAANRGACGGAPFEVEEAALEVLEWQRLYGTRPEHGGPNPHRAPLPDHRHRYVDSNGEGGSFCSVCGTSEPTNLPHDRTTEDDPWQSATPSPAQTAPTPQAPVPGSTPASIRSATDAVNRFTKVTSSVPTVPTGTRDRTAAVTTESADAFTSAAPAKREPDRDSWGRYKLPHPETGKRQAWTRATTMAKSISDTFALSQWSQRMVLKGASMRTDLVSLAGTLDVKTDKDKLNQLAEQAKDAAGQKIGAHLGSTLHTYTENVDGGAPLDTVPENHRADVAAYRAAMAEAGLVCVPQLIERITVVPEFGTAGTFDRVLRTADDDYVIGDLKTARTLEYGWQEIAIQLALYAHGVNASGVWDMGGERWEPAPKVRTDYGIVMHLPVGESTCTLYKVNIAAGWAAATLCASVRDWRKTRNLAEPYVVAEVHGPSDGAPTEQFPTQVGSPYPNVVTSQIWDPEPVTVRPPTWGERFRAVSSRGEAMTLYSEALKALGNGPELAGLVAVGMGKLRSLEERAG